MAHAFRYQAFVQGSTAKRYHYVNHDQLRCHLRDFLDAYKYAQPQYPQWSGTICKHLQYLDFRARSIHPKSDPADSGT
jgi:hypothetical protein